MTSTLGRDAMEDQHELMSKGESDWQIYHLEGKALEVFIAENWNRITTINLMMAHQLKAALRGLTQFSQGSERHSRALEHLGIYTGDNLDTNMLAQWLWLAPKDLGLSVNVVPADSTFCTAGSWNWATCALERFEFVQCSLSTASLESVFKLLSRISSLKQLILMMDITDGDTVDSRDATEALVAVLDHNPRLQKICFDGFLPEKTLLCQMLKNNQSLESLYLSDLSQKDHKGYFKDVALILENQNFALKDFRYNNFPCFQLRRVEWGPSSVEYFTALNRFGRLKIRKDPFNGETFV